MSALEDAKAALAILEALAVGVMIPASEGGAGVSAPATRKIRTAYVRGANALRALIAEHEEALRRIGVFEDGWNMLHFSCNNPDHGEAYKLMSDVALAPKIEVPE